MNKDNEQSLSINFSSINHSSILSNRRSPATPSLFSDDENEDSPQNSQPYEDLNSPLIAPASGVVATRFLNFHSESAAEILVPDTPPPSPQESASPNSEHNPKTPPLYFIEDSSPDESYILESPCMTPDNITFQNFFDLSQEESYEKHTEDLPFIGLGTTP